MHRLRLHQILGCLLSGLVFFAESCSQDPGLPATGSLSISENGRFFKTAKGKPFFWLGDTGWLLFSKLNEEQAERYLENRHLKGFNVIQVMLLHSLSETNSRGDSALVNRNIATPRIIRGKGDPGGHPGYWEEVDGLIDSARKLGMYMALVPVWGAQVKAGLISRDQARTYASFLAGRYKDKPNIIWINGGDTMGSDSTAIWDIIGKTLHAEDPGHLITFHPFGRHGSSFWFQNDPWLSFNMFQSGHRRYDQDTMGLCYGEDNWKYVRDDYSKKPVKPTLDGEPSYEGIPQGLHDTTQPRWTDVDVRRYAYWSVFAGACGFTYGDNAVMQMHRPTDKNSAYGAKKYWYEALNAPGAGEMIYLKNLMLSHAYFQRVPDSTLIVHQGWRYDYLAATRGKDYAYIYSDNGRDMEVSMGKIKGRQVKASWYNPRNGTKTFTGNFVNQGALRFDPPGSPKNGNDWVLILESIPGD